MTTDLSRRLYEAGCYACCPALGPCRRRRRSKISILKQQLKSLNLILFIAIMTYSMVEDAPVSPRGAAIYYWGGEEDLYNTTNSMDKKNDKEVDYLYASTFHKRTPYPQRHRRPTVRFHLTLQDEGDANHWLFAAATTTATTDLSLNEEKEEEEEKEEVLPTQTTTDDFASPNNTKQDFDSIPVIDLSQPKEVYAKQIGDACRNIGFFYIVNHGVDQKVMDGIMEMSRSFFVLDLSSKLQSNCNSGGENKKGYRGYFEIGGEDLDNKDSTRDLISEEGVQKSNNNATTKKGDYKEGFDCGLSDNEDALLFFGDNIWPNETNNPSIIGFYESVEKYQSELIRLSDKLLLALGLSLRNDNPNGGSDIAEDFFIKQSRQPMCTLRLLHYPAMKDSTATSSSSQGCGAHTDYGLFTILQQDSIGGLQVRNNQKQWIDAIPLKGSFVINCGDMLSRWSGGHYASTVHRVVTPSSCNDRYSVPFFFNPDSNALVKPLNGTHSGEAKRALEILQSRYDGTFKK